MEEELRGDCWESLKDTIEAKEVTNKSVSNNGTLKTNLRRCFSDNPNYRKGFLGTLS